MGGLQPELLYTGGEQSYNRVESDKEARVEAVRERYLEVVRRIREAAGAAGRDPAGITLVAVSKTVPPEVIAGLQPIGPVVLGENRVQEAQAKQPLLPGPDVFRWHLIGHLQSNKVNRAVELFEAVHSVDRLDLLHRLDRRCGETGRRLRVLLEVNLGGEASKSGCAEADVPLLLEAACSLPHLAVEGFMTIPPYREDPAEVRPYFRRLRQIRDEMAGRFGGKLPLRELSMGMSHDFDVAIQEGATLVRVGTAIFGARR